MNNKGKKAALRQDIKLLLKRLGPDEERMASFFESLKNFPPYSRAVSVLLYASLFEEASTKKIIAFCLADKKITAIPKVTDKNMDFFILNPARPFSAQTERGVFGIAEPKASCPLFIPSEKNLPVLIFVPGLAFNEQGFRLGRGGGYYDRYLAHLKSNRLFSAASKDTLPNKDGTQDKNLTLVGLCRSVQIVKDIPVEPHDLPVDFLITEKGIHCCMPLTAD